MAVISMSVGPKKAELRGAPQAGTEGWPGGASQPIIAGLAAFTAWVLKLFTMVPVLPSPL